MSYPLRKISIGSGRVLTATPVFDTYWRFAAKRQEVFFKRVKGAKPPWTNDPVIAGYRFTNAYRAADRVSQYLIRHVIYKGSQQVEEVYSASSCSSCSIASRRGKHFVTALVLRRGALRWSTVRQGVRRPVLRWRAPLRCCVHHAVSGAWAHSKASEHLALLEHMMRSRAPLQVARAKSLRSVFEILRGLSVARGLSGVSVRDRSQLQRH